MEFVGRHVNIEGSFCKFFAVLLRKAIDFIE